MLDLSTDRSRMLFHLIILDGLGWSCSFSKMVEYKSVFSKNGKIKPPPTPHSGLNYSNWSKYEIQAHNKSKKHIPTHRGESMCWRLWGVHCENVGWWDGWFSEMRTLEKLVHLVQINLPQSPYGPFKFLPHQWADKLTEGEDDHKTLLNNVLTQPNLRLDRSTEGSVLVLRGAVVCLGGWVIVLGGGIVIVVLVGLNVAVGKEKRGGWCLGAVQQVRDRR